tara:strand:- start:170 stop:499 length:330 start_codon:yes stop_codon:yes gene_type:complete
MNTDSIAFFSVYEYINWVIFMVEAGYLHGGVYPKEGDDGRHTIHINFSELDKIDIPSNCKEDEEYRLIFVTGSKRYLIGKPAKTGYLSVEYELVVYLRGDSYTTYKSLI